LRHEIYYNAITVKVRNDYVCMMGTIHRESIEIRPLLTGSDKKKKFLIRKKFGIILKGTKVSKKPGLCIYDTNATNNSTIS